MLVQHKCKPVETPSPKTYGDCVGKVYKSELGSIFLIVAVYDQSTGLPQYGWLNLETNRVGATYKPNYPFPFTDYTEIPTARVVLE